MYNGDKEQGFSTLYLDNYIINSDKPYKEFITIGGNIKNGKIGNMDWLPILNGNVIVDIR